MNIVPLPDGRIDDVMKIYDSFARPHEASASVETLRATLRRIRAQGGEVFVAEVDKTIVATYAIYVCQNLTRSARPFAVVENVICAPTHRRAGVGRALMEHAKRYATSHGCYKVMLQTGAGRQENHAFYEACGFSPDKRGYQVRFDA